MRKRIIITVFISIIACCDEQRDLYDTASPLIEIKGNWVPSLGMEDMSGRATAMLYHNDKVTKEFFLKPNSVTARVTQGEYDILIFNGMMFSEENTNLDHILFRNTNNIAHFEAVAVEVAPNARLVRANGEYIASNDMELLTVARTQLSVEGERLYYLKYKNGRDMNTNMESIVERTVSLTPYAVSYPTQVMIHLTNPSSAAIANGALRGFVGAVMMASGAPSLFDVTHHLRLNNLIITNQGTAGNPNDPETGTIESPWFVTFGPPLDESNRRYTFELSIILRDGQTVNGTFDITDQINATILRIKNYRQTPTTIQFRLTIPIEISVNLPKVEGESGVDVNDWEEDEIIRVVIKP